MKKALIIRPDAERDLVEVCGWYGEWGRVLNCELFLTPPMGPQGVKLPSLFQVIRLPLNMISKTPFEYVWPGASSGS